MNTPLAVADTDCDPGSLRALGWEQGCTFRLSLPLVAVTLKGERAHQVCDVHDVWLLATQDCDLAWVQSSRLGATIEVRPVLTDNPPSESGIRGRRLLLAADRSYLDADSPRLHVAPAVLAANQHAHETCMSPAGARAVKSWLGLRYDRPAVPQQYVNLYKSLSDQVAAKRHKQRAAHVRDVLVTFSEDAWRTTYDLIAVLPPARVAVVPEAVVEDLRRWLAEVALDVPEALGTAEGLHVVTTEELSWDAVETSYALDTSFVTWPRSGGGPVGAHRP